MLSLKTTEEYKKEEVEEEEESFVILAAANQISLDAAEVVVLSENDGCWASVPITIIVMV